MPAGRPWQIQQGLNTLSSNKSHRKSLDTKVDESEKAAVDPADGPENRAKAAKVGAVKSEMENPSLKPTPNNSVAQAATATNVNNYNLPERPDLLSGQELTNFKNSIKGGMDNVTTAETKTHTVFSKIENPGAGITVDDPIAIPATNEPALPTEALNLGTNVMGELEPDHLDFSGVDEALESELGDAGMAQGILEEEQSAFSLIAGDQLAALKEGPEGFSIEDIEGKITEQKGLLETAMNDESSGAEALRKQTMDSTRETNLNNVRTDQGAAKTAFEKAKETLLTNMKGEYDTAKGVVDTELENLKKKFDGEVDTGGRNGSKGIDAEIAAEIQHFKDTVEMESEDIDNVMFGNPIFDSSVQVAKWNRQPFIDELDKIITKYNGYVSSSVGICESAINTAKDNIDRMEEEFEDENGPIPADLQTAIDNIESDLNQVGTDVRTEANGLQEDLETKRDAAIQEVDDYIQELKDAWKDLLQGFLDLILAGGEAALRFILKLLGVSDPEAVINALKSAAGVIGAILKNPVQFARNLVDTIVGAFTEYFEPENFKNNVQEIIMTWFFGKPDLEFPSDFTAESWMKFAMDASGINQDSIEGFLSNGLTLPGGVTLDLMALLNGGPSGLWESIKGQLADLPIIESAGSLGGDSTADDGEAVEMATQEEILTEISGMGWETLLQEADSIFGTDTAADLENARYIFDQFVSGNIPDLIEDLKAHVDADILDIQTWLKEGLVDWLLTELVPRLLTNIATTFIPGGNLKTAIKAIYDGIMWVIDHKEQIWDIIQTIFSALPQIATGNIDGAKGAITTVINQGVGLLLDLMMTVGAGASPSQQMGKMVDRLQEKVSAGFEKLMEKIQGAIQNFIESIQKLLGKPRRKKQPGNGDDDGTASTTEKDFRGDPIPAADRIDGKIRNLEGRIDGHIDGLLDGGGSDNFEAPNYGTTYDGKIKTYKILQALVQVYRYDDEYLEDGELSREKAMELAARIRGEHKVFRTFTMVDSQEAEGETYDTPDNADHWAWEWTASPKASATGNKKRKAADQDAGKLPRKPVYTSAILPKLRTKVDAITVEIERMVRERKVHQSNLNVGVQLSPQGPVAMSDKRKMVRHLATVFLALDKVQTEVQVAFIKNSEELLWASNKNSRTVTYSGQTLDATLTSLQSTYGGELDTRFPPNTRQRRHYDKLMAVDRNNFGNYNLRKVAGGVSGQHAETGIVDEAGPDNIDYIGGTRRPCTACYLYMHLRGVDESAFNPHHGAYWDSNAALQSFSEWLWTTFQNRWVENESTLDALTTTIVNELDWDKAEEVVTNQYFATLDTLNEEGEPTRHTHDVDTDSEDEGTIMEHAHLHDIDEVDEEND